MVISLLLAGASLGFIIGRHDRLLTLISNGAFTSKKDIRAKSGPWGDLYYTPFTITPPEEALPIHELEAYGTHWFFKKYSFNDLSKLFQSAEVPVSQREALLDPKACHIQPAGLELSPPFDVLLSLPTKARQTIYRILAQFPENSAELHFIHKETLEDRFSNSGLSNETLALFKKLTCEHGDYLVFAGLSSMLAQLPSYEEKVRFVKALTQQKTLLLRVHVKPESDIRTLTGYWGKGRYAINVRTMLEAVSKVQGGSWIDILMLMPQIPASQLYIYPLVPENTLNDSLAIHDCHWTSFNFFRETPDPAPSSPQYYAQLLKTNYYPVPGDPRYGDMVVFSTPDGNIIHSAIYLADDIVFTKNGATAIHPWMLATISDLLKQYSFRVTPAHRLTITYLRNKSL